MVIRHIVHLVANCCGLSRVLCENGRGYSERRVLANSGSEAHDPSHRKVHTQGLARYARLKYRPGHKPWWDKFEVAQKDDSQNAANPHKFLAGLRCIECEEVFLPSLQPVTYHFYDKGLAWCMQDKGSTGAERLARKIPATNSNQSK